MQIHAGFLVALLGVDISVLWLFHCFLETSQKIIWSKWFFWPEFFYLPFPCIWRLLEKAKFSVLWLTGVFVTFPDLEMVLFNTLQWVEVHQIIKDVDRFLEALRDIERTEDVWSFCWCGLEPSFLCGTVCCFQTQSEVVASLLVDTWTHKLFFF